jgi:hypothetical protein
MKTIEHVYDSTLHKEKHCELLEELLRVQSIPDTFEREPILTSLRFLTCELARTRAKLHELTINYDALRDSVNERRK